MVLGLVSQHAKGRVAKVYQIWIPHLASGALSFKALRTLEYPQSKEYKKVGTEISSVLRLNVGQ